MKASEILFETTEEDRALISLADAIYKKLQTVDIDYKDITSYDYLEYDQYESTNEMPIIVGAIGELFDTPLTVLNKIIIQLHSDYVIRDIMRKEKDHRHASNPDQEVIYGFWDGRNNTITLNSDFINARALKTTITHELRHALDDIKSDYKTSLLKAKYNTASEKHKGKIKNYKYFAKPAEINARFVEVLHDVQKMMPIYMKKYPNNYKQKTLDAFYTYLENADIAALFPEKYKSTEYKRLIKRGVDFINKEMNYLLYIR